MHCTCFATHASPCRHNTLPTCLPSPTPFFPSLYTQPNFYQGKQGRSFNDYIGCCYLNDFNAAAATMACPNPAEPWSTACRQGLFAGPAWGHIYM